MDINNIRDNQLLCSEKQNFGKELVTLATSKGRLFRRW